MKAQLLTWLLVLSVSAWGAEKVSPEVFRALKDAEHHLNANHPAASLKTLETIKTKAKSGTEQALVEAYSSYAYLALGRHAQAASAAQAALANAGLPEELRPKLFLVLGQAQLQSERFLEAAEALEQALAKGADNEIRYLAAYARYRLRQYDHAAALIQQAIKASAAPPEEWYRLLVACYVEDKRYSEAAKTLEALLKTRSQNPELWRQWLALQLKARRPQEALAAMVLAWRAGQLAQEQLLDLARLHAAAGLPEKAARLIAEWRNEKRLPQTQDTLRLEAELWLMARERRQALPVFAQLASLSGKGSDWLTAARLAAELQSWSETAKLARNALQAGLSDPAEAELWLGIAAYHLDDPAAAEAALTRAQNSRRHMAYAQYWRGCLKKRPQRCR